MTRGNVSFLRRQSRSVAGDASGGGDSDFDPLPQNITLGKFLTGTQTKTARLPKGTVILGGINIPYPPAAGDSHVVAASGDITIGLTSGGTDYLGSTAAENYTYTAISNGVVLSEDKLVYFSAIAVVGVTRAALEVILPTMKP